VMAVIARDGHAIILPALRVFPRRTAHPHSALSGGMGAQTTHYVGLADEIADRVVLPILHEIRGRRESYQGALTVNLRLTPDGTWKVLEVNCHWGDPETQCALTATDFSLSEALAPAARASPWSTCGVEVCTPARAVVSVVVARTEYPMIDVYRPIRYRPELLLERRRSTVLPYDGTSLPGAWVESSSGRFCSITSAGATLDEACQHARTDTDFIIEKIPGLDHNPAVTRRSLSTGTEAG
jgi:phosphoribosylamine--glycine ligase